MCGLGVLRPEWFDGMKELRMLNLEYNRLGLGASKKGSEKKAE